MVASGRAVLSSRRATSFDMRSRRASWRPASETCSVVALPATMAPNTSWVVRLAWENSDSTLLPSSRASAARCTPESTRSTSSRITRQVLSSVPSCELTRGGSGGSSRASSPSRNLSSADSISSLKRLSPATPWATPCALPWALPRMAASAARGICCDLSLSSSTIDMYSASAAFCLRASEWAANISATNSSSRLGNTTRQACAERAPREETPPVEDAPASPSVTAGAFALRRLNHRFIVLLSSLVQAATCMNSGDCVNACTSNSSQRPSPSRKLPVT